MSQHDQVARQRQGRQEEAGGDVSGARPSARQPAGASLGAADRRGRERIDSARRMTSALRVKLEALRAVSASDVAERARLARRAGFNVEDVERLLAEARRYVYVAPELQGEYDEAAAALVPLAAEVRALRAATRAPATIDAPAEYDESRATIDVDAAPAANDEAPAVVDRSATRQAATIDAPATYEEDRGTIAVQRRATGAASAGDPLAVAAAGVAGAGGPLPHLDAIQRSFGAHDMRHVQAHVGGAAASASAALGAEAYATGDRVAFAAAPSLHTAAHEAAHVVQQRAGVHLKGGIGEAGDAYEQHADAVADAVVRGESAEALLGEPGRDGGGGAVQRKDGVGAPRTEHTLVCTLVEGKHANLTLKTTFSTGGAVAQEEGSHYSVEALRPKIETNLAPLYKELKLAVVSGEATLLNLHGFTINVEATGPELSSRAVEPSSSLSVGDLTLFAISVSGKGDIAKWLGLPDGMTLETQLEGEIPIGPDQLASLARMLAASEKLERHTEELHRLTNQADEMRQRHDDAERRHSELSRKLDALETQKVSFRERIELEFAYRSELDELEIYKEQQRRGMQQALERSDELRRAIERETHEMAEATRSLKGPLARLANKVKSRSAKLIGRAIARLLPVLNLVSAILDAYDVYKAFLAWRDADYGLPELGLSKDGDSLLGESKAPGQGSGQGTEPGKNGAPIAKGPVSDKADRPDGQRGATGVVDADAAEPDGTQDAKRGPAGVHPIAKRLLKEIEQTAGEGFELTPDQIEAIAAMVPADLTEEQFRTLVERLLADGDRVDNVDVLLARITWAVVTLEHHAPRVTSMVDGKPADDAGEGAVDEGGASGAGAGTEKGKGQGKPKPNGKAKRKKGGTGGKGKPKARRGDGLTLSPEMVRTWLHPDGHGGLEPTAAFDEWFAKHAGELTITVDGKTYTLVDGEVSGDLTPEGAWDVSVSLEFRSEAGVERGEHFRWLMDPATGGTSQVIRGSMAPLEEIIVAMPDGVPPRVTNGSVAQFGDHELVIQSHEIVGPQPDGLWRIRFMFQIRAVAGGASGGYLADDGTTVPLANGKFFAKTLDVAPRGR